MSVKLPISHVNEAGLSHYSCNFSRTLVKRVQWAQDLQFYRILSRKSLISRNSRKMADKGIPKIPLFDLISSKMSCPLFGVMTVLPLKLHKAIDKGNNYRKSDSDH